MREILFRGKRADNGEWVYGSPIFQDNYVIIRFWNSEEFEYEEHLIIPETVGQYTGLTDKNGKKIFEGDILNGLFYLHPYRKIFQVGYAVNGFYFFDEDDEDEVGWHPSHIVDYEVIGNIHDNPELLKGGEAE